ncbi:hypothetical protein AVEN_23182-1 [Araneus ventricosus]|uniref:Uncharacterized protein n=1 Tax=Araneus ventricosus TaxID=182803 RepID=A0A4Y2FE13_ARAVE|nr:hypothetical protein AVEN_23182-1 [Araneus ventricosus]
MCVEKTRFHSSLFCTGTSCTSPLKSLNVKWPIGKFGAGGFQVRIPCMSAWYMLNETSWPNDLPLVWCRSLERRAAQVSSLLSDLTSP